MSRPRARGPKQVRYMHQLNRDHLRYLGDPVIASYTAFAGQAFIFARYLTPSLSTF